MRSTAGSTDVGTDSKSSSHMSLDCTKAHRPRRHKLPLVMFCLLSCYLKSLTTCASCVLSFNAEAVRSCLLLRLQLQRRTIASG